MVSFILRWTGIIMIVGGCGSIGFQYAGDAKRRLDELRYAKKVLWLFRGEIQYHHALLEEAFSSVGARVREPFSSFLRELGGRMKQDRGIPFLTIYDKTVEKTLLVQTSFGKSRLERLRMFAEQLGYLDREAQLAQTDLFLEQLDESIREEEARYRKNGHLYRCLGVMGGMILSLLLM